MPLERLQELQVDQKAGRVQQDEATRSLQKSWQRLRCQQIRKLSEVRQVYPVQQCQAYWTIRGIGLRRTETLKHQDPREEQDASTALGYLSHLLVSAASLRRLKVPPRWSARINSGHGAAKGSRITACINNEDDEGPGAASTNGSADSPPGEWLLLLLDPLSVLRGGIKCLERL
eukprot:symbB.v1.2.010571.t1/scaffold691.1/size191848/12